MFSLTVCWGKRLTLANADSRETGIKVVKVAVLVAQGDRLVSGRTEALRLTGTGDGRGLPCRRCSSKSREHEDVELCSEGRHVID